jgi:hypothetical protein
VAQDEQAKASKVSWKVKTKEVQGTNKTASLSGEKL